MRKSALKSGENMENPRTQEWSFLHLACPDFFGRLHFYPWDLGRQKVNLGSSGNSKIGLIYSNEWQNKETPDKLYIYI